MKVYCIIISAIVGENTKVEEFEVKANNIIEAETKACKVLKERTTQTLQELKHWQIIGVLQKPERVNDLPSITP